MAATYQPSQWLIPKNANTDKVGNYSFEFDGTADVINISDPGATIWAYGETTWSVSFWMNPDAFTNQDGLVCRLLDTNNRVAIKLDYSGVGNDGLMVLISDSGVLAYVEWNNLFTAGTWFHVCVTYDSGTVITYIDGADQGAADASSGTIPTSMPNLSGADIDIGNDIHTAGRFFNGNISEISIFNYKLESGEVTTLYGSAGAGVGNPMALDVVPVAYYKGDRAALGDQWAVPNQVSQDYVFDFDGTSDYINVGDSNDFTFALAPFSVSAWVNMTDATDFITLAKDVAGGREWVLRAIGDKLHFYIVDNVAGGYIGRLYNTTVTSYEGTWIHTAYTYDGGTSNSGIKIYLNGLPVDDTDYSSGTFNTMQNTATVLRIGNQEYAPGYYSDGNISNAAIFNSELSAGNILTLYNNGTPETVISFSPISWWKLDDSATFSTNWSVPDAGSASNTGTSSGMTQTNLVPATVTRGTTLYSNYSFDFDGATDWFTFPDIAFLKAGGDYVSISVWVQATGGTQLGFWSCRSATPDQINLWRQTDNTLSFDILSSVAGDISVRTDAAAINDDTWYNIVATFDGTEGSASDRIKVYVNGVAPAQTVTGTGTNLPQGGVTVVNYIGRTFSGVDHLGYESNVAIWDSTLTAANALTIYNNGRPADLTSLSPVVWWRLGENASWDGSTWTATDQIGSNDATGVGPPNLVGEAPQSFANGLSVSMDIDDRIGESGFSDENALSYNMGYDARKADVPG